MAQPPEEQIKISANLPAETVAQLKAIALERKVPMTQVLKDAIALDRLVTDEVAKGGKLLIEQPGQVKREIIIPK